MCKAYIRDSILVYYGSKLLETQYIPLDNIFIEILKFIIGLNIADCIFWLTHFIQHKYFYNLHKEHHKIRNTCILFGNELGFIDLLLTSIPIILSTYFMNFSTIVKYVFSLYFLINTILVHKIYSYGDKKIFCYHNYHHYNQKYNLSIGIFGTFGIFDHLFGTYKDVNEINN